MKYKNIPRTDLSVSTVCLGLSHIDIGKLSEQNSFDLLDAFYEEGGNFLDTAHNYGDWIKGAEGKCLSEKTIGRWIKKRGNRREIIIGTKGGHHDLVTLAPNSSSESIVGQLNQSLDSLQTDYIDLYWLHRDDPSRPVAHFIDMLNEQVLLGKIKYFGCSNWTVRRIRQAMDYAGKHNMQSFVANQMWWSLAAPNLGEFPDKTVVAMDAETIDFHKETGLAAIPYSSQAKGFFSKMSKFGEAGLDEGFKKLYYNERNILIFERLKKVSSILQKSITEITFAYLTSHPFVTIPIIGPRTLAQLKESVKASEVVLPEETLSYLNLEI